MSPNSITQRILAIGGGGFMMEGCFTPIDQKIIDLTGKKRPRICILPTPTGDADEVLHRFYTAYDDYCDAYQLTPFRKPTARTLPLRDIANALLEFDALFVSGGSTKSALGVWREWEIDHALRIAYDAGVLLSGMSAGAICWFQQGFSDSFNDGGYAPLDCLGLLASGGCPHHETGSPRAAALEAAIVNGQMPTTLAIDDYAAVLFHNGTPNAVYRWRDQATATWIARSAEGVALKQTLTAPTVQLPTLK